jgi:general secretion pathway protein D
MFRTTRCWLLLILIFFTLGSITWAASGKLIDLDFKNADINDLLRALAAQAGVHIWVDPDVSGDITIHLSKVTFAEALTIITKSNNLLYTKENNVYIITQFLKVDYDKGLLTVETRDAKLASLLRVISQKCEKNLVPDPLLLDRISIVLEKVSYEDGIKTILTQANCVTETIGAVTYIRKGKEKLQFTVEYQNDLLNVDAQNIPLTALTREITNKSGSSIIHDQNLNPPITIFFKNLSVGDGLGVICDTFNLQLSRDGPVWRIVKKPINARVKYQDKLLSLDVDGVDAIEIANEISRVTGVNITLAKEVRGTVSAHFQGMPLAKALSVMFEPQGWTVDRMGKEYHIAPNTNQNPQNIRVSYDVESQLFDLDIQYAQLTPVLSEMARKADLNMVVMSSVNWSLSNIRLKQQSIDKVLDYLLKGTVFTYKYTNETYIIGDGMIPRPETSDFSAVKVYPVKYIKADQLLNSLPPVFPRQDFVLIQDKNALIVTAPPMIHLLFTKYLDQVDVESIEDKTEVVKIKYLKAEDVLKYIPSSIPKNDIIVVKEMNAITVSGPQNLVNQVKQYIDKIDQPNPMIVFDVLVIKISNSNSFDWGLKGTIPTGGGTSLTIDTGEGTIAGGTSTSGSLASIDLMIKNGKAKVLQNPTITTLNGYPTSFAISSKRNLVFWQQEATTTTTTTTNPILNPTFKSVDNSLIITITPWVSVNDIITMEIKPKITEYGAIPKGQQMPDTSENNTETTVRVNNKQTVIISGLRSTRKEKTVNKVPFLGDIPLIGLLFRSNNTKDVQDEFVIMITPTLVYDAATKDEASKRIENQYGSEVLKELHKEEEQGKIDDKNQTKNN